MQEAVQQRRSICHGFTPASKPQLSNDHLAVLGLGLVDKRVVRLGMARAHLELAVFISALPAW